MADIPITIIIPDAWITRVQATLTGQADKDITIEFNNAHKRYSYAAKGSDTWIQFAKRAFREHLKQQIKVYELSISQQEYSDNIQNIELPGEDVPEDILT